MKEMQDFLRKYQKEMNWEIKNGNYEEAKTSLLNNYMLLTTEISEIAEEFRALFNTTKNNSNNENEELAFLKAKEEYKENIGKEIADCFAYLVKFANYFEIDLEESFYGKMNEVKLRSNKDCT
jgi:NTP pyrophosphatase (non-canonical NTP hydrolase)